MNVKNKKTSIEYIKCKLKSERRRYLIKTKFVSFFKDIEQRGKSAELRNHVVTI